MNKAQPIPVFTLFGETEHFPDVVHCERIIDRAMDHDWRIPAHRHAQMSQLFWISDGTVEAIIDGKSSVLSSGEFLYIPAQIVHEFVFSPQTIGYVISLPNSVVGSIGPVHDSLQPALSSPLIGRYCPELDAMVDLMNTALKSDSIFRAQTSVALAHAILSKLAEIAVESNLATTPAMAKLSELNRLIADHASDGWGATQYANALCISTGHLSRLCRDATGVGATAYIEQIIMEEACRMLAFTQFPISEIGYRLGYDDPSYFSKRFRSTRQQTPTEYRKRFAT